MNTIQKPTAGQCPARDAKPINNDSSMLETVQNPSNAGTAPPSSRLLLTPGNDHSLALRPTGTSTGTAHPRPQLVSIRAQWNKGISEGRLADTALLLCAKDVALIYLTRAEASLAKVKEHAVSHPRLFSGRQVADLDDKLTTARNKLRCWNVSWNVPSVKGLAELELVKQLTAIRNCADGFHQWNRTTEELLVEAVEDILKRMNTAFANVYYQQRRWRSDLQAMLAVAIALEALKQILTTQPPNTKLKDLFIDLFGTFNVVFGILFQGVTTNPFVPVGPSAMRTLSNSMRWMAAAAHSGAFVPCLQGRIRRFGYAFVRIPERAPSHVNTTAGEAVPGPKKEEQSGKRGAATGATSGGDDIPSERSSLSESGTSSGATSEAATPMSASGSMTAEVFNTAVGKRERSDVSMDCSRSGNGNTSTEQTGTSEPIEIASLSGATMEDVSVGEGEVQENEMVVVVVIDGGEDRKGDDERSGELPTGQKRASMLKRAVRAVGGVMDRVVVSVRNVWKVASGFICCHCRSNS